MSSPLPHSPGSQPSLAERYLNKWPDRDSNFFPEGMDCYDDPLRGAFVEASYSGISGEVANSQAGEPIIIIGRTAEKPHSHGFERTIALGELAGGGAGLFLDFRSGKIVFPTRQYAMLVRTSLSAITGYRGPTVREGLLESDAVLDWQGLLPPKGDLLDQVMNTRFDGRSRRHQQLRSVEKEELWHNVGEIAIGEEKVVELIERTEKTNHKRTRRLYRNDFSALAVAMERYELTE